MWKGIALRNNCMYDTSLSTILAHLQSKCGQKNIKRKLRNWFCLFGFAISRPEILWECFKCSLLAYLCACFMSAMEKPGPLLSRGRAALPRIPVYFRSFLHFCISSKWKRLFEPCPLFQQIVVSYTTRVGYFGRHQDQRAVISAFQNKSFTNYQ